MRIIFSAFNSHPHENVPCFYFSFIMTVYRYCYSMYWGHYFSCQIQ